MCSVLIALTRSWTAKIHMRIVDGAVALADWVAAAWAQTGSNDTTSNALVRVFEDFKKRVAMRVRIGVGVSVMCLVLGAVIQGRSPNVRGFVVSVSQDR
ncbi:MAG: hypothetical protein C5B57_05765 [Blastocatellia bacterium]|nr:MAG: hypothetical protein C5B57_05765 [Blastocatellia bacterium]